MSFSSQRGPWPATRMRRMRADDFSRRLMQETTLSAADLIQPLFVIEGEQQREAVASMPGVERLSVDLLVEECKTLAGLGSPAVALFPVINPEQKSLVPGTVRFSICSCHFMLSLPLGNPKLASVFTDFYQ